MMAESKQTWDTVEDKELNTEECSAQETKFKQMYENILEIMISLISKYQQTHGKSREVRLSKMKRLYAVFTNSKNRPKLKIETLVKHMEVLRKLREKADKVPGIHEYFNAKTEKENITVNGELSKISSTRDKSQSRVHHILPKRRTEHDSSNIQAGKHSSSKQRHTNYEANPNNKLLPAQKNSRALQHLLAVDSLCNLYKCMDKKCSWTENGACNFLNHLRNEHCNKKDSGWNHCSYCPFQGNGTPHDLVQHIKKEHGHCQYQRAYCFYRGMTHDCVVLHQQSTTGDGDNPLKMVNLDQPVLDDVISRHSESSLIAGGTIISIQSEMCTEESTAGTNRAARKLLSQMTESEITDAVQKTSFEMVESRVTEAARESSVAPISENPSLPEIAPLQSPQVSSSLQETYVKQVFSEYSPFWEQDTETNHGSDEGGFDEDDDVQALDYQLAMEGKQCNQVTSQSNCKLSKSQLGRESPLNTFNSVTEPIKETDRETLSDPVILVTKSCREATAKVESKLSEKDTICGNCPVSTQNKLSTKTSIENADSGTSVDSKSEIGSSAEAGNTACGADKPQTIQASEGLAAAEDSVTQGDKQKQFTASGLTGEDLYVCGNAHCVYRVATASQLLEHLYVCDLSREGVLQCPHCSRPFKAFNTLVNHLRFHGIPRYKCALCTYRDTTPAAVETHLKHQHKVSCTEITPVDHLHKNHETDTFVVSPKEKGKSRYKPTGCLIKTMYRPEDRHLLPMTSVLKDPIQCALCSYKTKMCSKMRKHLGLHSDSHVDAADISTMEHVNLKACLEWNEKMFDKTTNLAVSSNIDVSRPASSETSSNSSSAVIVGAASEGELPQQAYRIPQYVEERRRYVCSAVRCNYLSCSDAMLQLHVRVLHKDEAVYRCPHCPPPAPEILLDGLGAHLCMHGDQLYGCAYCPYIDFVRGIVERHIADRHPEESAFVIVLRDRAATKAETSIESKSSGAQGSSDKSGKEVQSATFPATYQLKKRTAALRAMELLQNSLPDWSEPVPSGSPVSSPNGSDSEEEGLEKKRPSTSSPKQKKKRASKEPNIPCIDCGKKYINIRGLKLHIRKNHICTAKWLCGYCYQGRSTEMAVKHHCSVRHQGLPELVKYNEEAASLNLDDDFWETNYGLPPRAVTTASPPPLVQQPGTPSEERDSHVDLPELLSVEEAQGSLSCQLKLHEDVVEATAQHYACSKCSFVALLLHVLRRHFEAEHHDSEFCYIVKPPKLPSDNVIVRTETGASTLCDASDYVCGARGDSEEQSHSDHQPNAETKDSFETVIHDTKRKKFECPSCCFISDNYEILKEHIERHVNPFECGYCEQHCDLEGEVSGHCQASHVDCDAHMRELGVENLTRFVIERTVIDDESWCPIVSVSEKKSTQRVPRKIQNVARMSTALSAVSARLLIKSVSAKRPKEDFSDPPESDDPGIECPYSYYGRSPSPIDENRLLAFASYGGSVIRMSMSTFNKLYNIYPTVKVHDLKHEKFVPV